MSNNPESESTTNRLKSYNSILAYLEIDTRNFDMTTQESFQKVKNLYQDSLIFLGQLSAGRPDPTFKVKIYANIVVIADDFSSEWDVHTSRRLRSLMALNYFLAAFQHLALVKYNWLIHGYMTTGQFYMPYLFEDEEGIPQGTDIDFLWGKALVEAYRKNKVNRYPGIQIDTSILDFCNNQTVDRAIWESSYYDYSNNPKIIFIDFLGIYNNISAIGNPELRIQNFSDVLERIELNKLFPDDQLIFLKRYLDHVKKMPQIPRQEPSVQNNIVDPEPFTSSIDTTEMKEYFIAYLDMLGTKDKIEDDDDDHWLNAIENIYDASHKFLELNHQTLDILGERMVSYLTPQIKIFSDNILFAIEEVDDSSIEDEIVAELIKFAGYFQNYALLGYNWQLRGCITKGLLYLDENYLWGPVIIYANNLEEKAKEPRIIFDTTRVSLPTCEENELIYEADNLKPIIQKDDDMEYFIGYSDLIVNGTETLRELEKTYPLS